MRSRSRVALALGLALLAAAALRLALPDPARRDALAYALVATLGYGHLLGASLGASRSGGGLRRAGLALALLDLLALYLALAPASVLALLGLATWHAVENELALAAGARGRPGPLGRRARDHAVPLAVTAAVAALAAAALPDAERGRALAALPLPDLAARGVRFADVFTVTTLHHLLSWLLVTGERALRARDRVLAARLAYVHALPATAAVVLAAAPHELAPLRGLFFSPALYLFWSAAHVVHTAERRGLAAPAS